MEVDINKLRITESRFSPTVCEVANIYGFKSIGPFRRFLKGLSSPNVKLYHGTKHIRATKIIREIDNFENKLVEGWEGY